MISGDFSGVGGSYIRGFIPQAAQQVASGTDVDKANPTVADYAKGMAGLKNTVERHPKGFVEQVKMGIPGKYGRESVPKSLSAAKASLKSKILPLASKWQAADNAAQSALKRGNNDRYYQYNKTADDLKEKMNALVYQGVKDGYIEDNWHAKNFVHNIIYPRAKSKPWKSTNYR